LNFVVAAELFARRPTDEEGALTRLRASLVRESALAEIARELELGPNIRFGQGEQRSGGQHRASILSDVVESLIGACYLDSGFEAGRTLVLRLMGERLEHLPASETLKDPKTRLQEWLQQRGLERPVYSVVAEAGADHERVFTVEAVLPSDQRCVQAQASSRRKAEQGAAASLLEVLETNETAWSGP
jgi:ribonuclease-3